MDLNTLRGLSTIFVMIAFLGVCWWAFSPKRKQGFNDAANLPFADDVDIHADNGATVNPLHPKTDEERQY